MTRVSIAFTRSGNFTLTGKLSVDVENEHDWEEIQEAADNHQFSEFLPQNMTYANSVWEFTPLEEPDTEYPESA